MKKYGLFDHTADIGVEIYGRTRKDLFTNAARALTDIMLEIPPDDETRGERRTLDVEGADTADLLVNYLRELLYIFNGEAGVIRHCDIIAWTPKKLAAELRIAPYDRMKHRVKMELKAVTYHGLSIEKDRSGWKARVIFDV